MKTPIILPIFERKPKIMVGLTTHICPLLSVRNPCNSSKQTSVFTSSSRKLLSTEDDASCWSHLCMKIWHLEVTTKSKSPRNLIFWMFNHSFWTQLRLTFVWQLCQWITFSLLNPYFLSIWSRMLLTRARGCTIGHWLSSICWQLRYPEIYLSCMKIWYSLLQ